MRNFWKRVGSFAQWKQSVNGLMSVGQRRSESKVEVGLKQHEQRKMLDTLSCWLAKIKHDVPHRMMMMITMIMMMMMCLQEVRSWWTCLVKWLATVQSWLLMKLKRSPAVNCHTLDVTVNSHSNCQVCLSVCLSVTHYIQVDKSQVGDVFLCVSASLCISLCFCVGLSVCLCVTLCISVCLSVCLCITLCISVCLSVCVCISVCLSVCLCVTLYISVCLSVCVCVTLCVCLYVCASLCVSLCVCVGSELSDIRATVTDPSGVEDCCDISQDSPGVYQVLFKPRQNGLHFISVSHQNSAVPGLLVTLASCQLSPQPGC